MTNKEVLERAIKLAVDRGWKPEMVNSSYTWCDGVGCFYHSEPQMWNAGDTDNTISNNDIIFNHDFAKALWGNPSKNKFGDLVHGIPDDFNSILYEWQYQLQQMVIAPDPIKYLGENITEIKEK